LLITIICLCNFSLFSCVSIEHASSDVKSVGETVTISAKYDEIILNWEESYFIHDDYTIDIPSDWNPKGFFDWHIDKSEFDDVNKHDINYQYEKTMKTSWGGDTWYETEFLDLINEDESEIELNFCINVKQIDLDSKILIQDEVMNDDYFKYDLNNDYYNYCYFKIAKNDVDQLKDGSFNEIRLSLVTLLHYDDSKSFKVRIEDGIANVGYYSDVGIYYNPDNE
jgi:hypothetical protein